MVRLRVQRAAITSSVGLPVERDEKILARDRRQPLQASRADLLAHAIASTLLHEQQLPLVLLELLVARRLLLGRQRLHARRVLAIALDGLLRELLGYER